MFENCGGIEVLRETQTPTLAGREFARGTLVRERARLALSLPVVGSARVAAALLHAVFSIAPSPALWPLSSQKQCCL